MDNQNHHCNIDKYLQSIPVETLPCYKKYNVKYEYFDGIYKLMGRSLKENKRLSVIRFDLHIPKYSRDTPIDHTFAISRFIEALKYRLKADQTKKRREGKRTYPLGFKYLWAREIGNESNRAHYHVAIFVNKDSYNELGNFRDRRGLSHLIIMAWSTTFKLDYEHAQTLVHFPHEPVAWLNPMSNDFEASLKSVLNRLIYLAKYETKVYGVPSRNFGMSQK
ncbi:inovirus Gp2 family protein [Gayadomonas joobiniege]|uniref:inovirus Gp2 family protein n=1 Tax=Gayadomonas joobiniege TaxID=1234606 RepID=UPI0003692EC8|nr:inovirus Gp2 family protein [Gayadomonas joobiniege]